MIYQAHTSAMPKRYRDRNRNTIISRAVNDLDVIINHHNPEVDVPIKDGIWDRLDKMAVEIEIHGSIT